MSADLLEEIVSSHGPDEPSRYVALADLFLSRDDKHAAAAALDRAFGLAPELPGLAAHRAGILDELALVEHGLTWRYIPAGTFLMGSMDGDPDERPVHPRRVGAFWITDVPISWGHYCLLMDWDAPPKAWPRMELAREAGFDLHQRNKIRLQYCEEHTRLARDWHAHAGMTGMGTVPRDDEAAPIAYGTKPMVATIPQEAHDLAAKLSRPGVAYALPLEAQWEKAARGGLVGKRYAWGDDPPTRALADFDRMGDFRLHDPRAFPANGYGVHGMCGGVSEWCSDPYDATAYHHARANTLPLEVQTDVPPTQVLRGGSWTDCADAITVSFRTSRGVGLRAGFGISPTVGFRLVRLQR